MNVTTPRGLQNAVFFTIGKLFCLKEDRALKLSQLQRDSDKYVYYENVSKNRSGSFKQLHVRSKVVPVYSCPEAGQRCPVRLLDLFISEQPEEAKKKELWISKPWVINSVPSLTDRLGTYLQLTIITVGSL